MIRIRDKKCFFHIFLLLFAAIQFNSCKQKVVPKESQNENKKKIEFEINRNEITFRIAYNLSAGKLRFPPRPNPVRNNLEEYFDKHKNHNAVLLIKDNEIGYDDTVSEYLLHQEEFPKFGGKYDFSEGYKSMKESGFSGVDTLYPMIYKELHNFYNDADVEQFITDMDFYYSGAIKEIEKITEQYDIVEQMEEYCKMENFRYVLSPEPLFMTGGTRGIGPAVMTESGRICYQFISPSEHIDLSNEEFSLSNGVYGYSDDSYIRKVSVHEFGHSFVRLDMEDEETQELINQKGPELFDGVEDKLQNTGIGDFHTYIEEHIVRLLEIRIAEKYISKEEAERIRIENANFIYLNKMEDLIVEEYEKKPDGFKSFSEFFPVLLTAVDKI